MQGKSIVKFFLIIMTIVCAVQFLFMWPTSRVENDAEEYAKEQVQGIKDDFQRAEAFKTARASYLDSMSSEKIFTIPLLKSYTYQELKQQQLKLGLDLKGGMSVVLQVNLKNFLVSLSGNNQNPKFREALKNASERLKDGQDDYITLFAQEWNKIADGEKLADIFQRNASLRDEINIASTDEQVISVLRNLADETVQLTFKRLKQRINKFGVSQPNVSLDKARDLITVELPGISNPERARNYLQASADLEFWHVYRVSDPGIIAAFREADKLLATEQGGSQDKTTQVSDNILRIDTLPVLDSLGNLTGEVRYDTIRTTGDDAIVNESNGPLFKLFTLNQAAGTNQQFMMPLSVMGTAKKNNMKAISRMLAKDEVQQLFPPNIKFLWSRDPAVNYQTGEETGMYELYAVKTLPGTTDAPLEGDRVTNASTQPDPVTGNVTVTLEMDQKGARIWGEMTTEAARDNQRPIAIVLDDQVVSAPSVNEPIKNGSSSISGNFSVQEGQDLANILKIGKLPAETKIIQESVVGPSLGQENINKSLISLLVGFGLLLIIMAAYYGGAGLISIICLLTNVFFILGTLSSIGTVLTLPGIAGIVLTMGMAVDANVIIYERIREELELGKTLLNAIEDGFQYSYSAIIDGNVTTLLIGIVLAYYGLGPIKGFGIVLIVGIICTLLSAVLFTRLIVDWWIKKGKNLSFWTRVSEGMFANMNFDWMGKKKIAYIISGTLLVASIVSIATRGFEYGLDFKGGRSYDVQFAHDVDLDALRDELAVQLDGEPVVKSVDVHNKYNITTDYLINESSKDADSIVLSKLYAGINKVTGGNLNFQKFKDTGSQGTHVTRSSKVGPTIADDIINSSWKAAILALLLVFVYILIRFNKWQYSLGGVIGLMHDSIIMMGVFSLLHGILPFSLEMDQTFIAALLTIIGYSINDTVIIFDRVREYLGRGINKSKDEVINMAVNNTFRRTVMTAFTTLITITALFLFGGDSIRGFAFAIMIGIIVGTYSSVFVSTSILSELSGDLTRKVKKSSQQKYSKSKA